MPIQPIDSGLLSAIRNPQALPSNADRMEQAQRIQGGALENQVRQGQIAEQQQKAKDQQTLDSESAIATEILHAHGGDLESALPDIAIHAPHLLPHFQTAVDNMQKNAASKLTGQKEQLAAVQGSQADEKTVTPPPMTLPPVQYQGTPQGLQPDQADTRQVDLPSHQEIQPLPTVRVGNVDVQPQSRQQIDAAAYQKYRQEKILEAQLREAKNIDPNSPQGIAAEVDKAKQLSNVPQRPTGAPSEFETTLSDFMSHPDLVKRFGPGAIGLDKYKQSQKVELAATEQAAKNHVPDIANGSKEFHAAQDLAYGKLTYSDLTKMYPRSDANTATKLAIYDKARELNPNFNVAQFEMGFKLASSTKVQQQLASMDNVKAAVPDLLKLSEEASRTGVTILNNLISKGGVAVSDKHYSNLATARSAFADELSGALGFGSATDMSRSMGFDMTRPDLSPDAFRSQIQDVVIPFIDRKKQTLLNQMGVYGQPGMQPGGGAAPASGSGAKVGDIKTFPNGKKGKWDGQGWEPIPN
jgi:hypothetical protein